MASGGIKQRDPLSPFLFFLVSEVLGALINKLFENGHYERFVIVKEKIHIPTLQFADDTFQFCKCDKEMLIKPKKAIMLIKWYQQLKN